VNGLSSRRLDLCGRIVAETIIVLLQVLDQGLEVADPRPEPSTLQDETIV